MEKNENRGITNKRFSKQLNYLMEKKKIGNEKLAALLGEELIYINLIRNGKRKSVQLDTILRISKALKVEPYVFYGSIRKEFIDDTSGLTNEKFTSILIEQMKLNKISFDTFVKRMNCDEIYAAKLVLGIKYQLTVDELMKVINALGVEQHLFWDCLEF